MSQHSLSSADVTAVMTAMTDPERPWVLEAIDSILGQTEKPAAVIVMVETNNSWIEQELQRSKHPGDVKRLVQLHRIPLARLGAVRNAGTQRAQTRWVAFLDGDDVWRPEKLARQVAAAHARPDADFIGADLVFINEAGRPFGFANGTNPTPSSWMVRRELLLKHPFDPDNKVGEDYFWLLATRAESVRVRVPEVLVQYRIRASSISALQASHSKRRKLRELAARSTSFAAVRYPLLAVTYLRYTLKRRAQYEV